MCPGCRRHLTIPSVLYLGLILKLSGCTRTLSSNPYSNHTDRDVVDNKVSIPLNKSVILHLIIPFYCFIVLIPFSIKKLKELIPRQMFEISIQAAIGTKVISKAVVKALRKNMMPLHHHRLGNRLL